jgi:tetratricopeptide (TPR) repeat protein
LQDLAPTDRNFLPFHKQSIEYLYWKGLYEDALEHCKRIFAFIEDTSGVMWREIKDCQIRSLWHLGRMLEAIQELENGLLTCTIVDPGTHYFASELYFAAGKFEKSFIHSLWFLRQGARPTVYHCWNRLGESLKFLGYLELGNACVAKAERIASKMHVTIPEAEYKPLESCEFVELPNDAIRWIEAKVYGQIDEEEEERISSVRDL